MGLLDRLTRQSRVWDERAAQASANIQRAAALQAQTRGIASPQEEVTRLDTLYNVSKRASDWRDFGDVAFHVAASYPPDLAYLLIYALRQFQPLLGYDPVQYVFVAMQHLHRFRPERAALRVERLAEIETLFNDSQARGRAAAKLLAREVSVTPLRWASGIFAHLDAAMRAWVWEELQRFNPDGARVLSGESRMYLLTGRGLLRSALRGMCRLLFGTEE